MTSRRVDCILFLNFLLCLSCCSQGLVSDGESLLKFKATVVNVDGSNLDLLSSWGPSGKDPCNGNVSDDILFGIRMESSWQGLSCFNSSRAGWEVSELLLSIPDLVSSDVSALSELTKLQYLVLQNMMLSGPLPDVGKMETLTYLDLSGNRFNGSLPQRFPSSLAQIRLSNNSLSGDVRDTNLFTLQSLEKLYLSENNLTGTFPDMTGLQSLTHFDISQNGFEGPWPSGIPNLSLVLCNMSSNRFSGRFYGPLDAAYGLSLDLSNNRFTYENLADTVTSNFTSLRELHLGDNNLQGDASILSALNYSYPNLEVLDLRNSGLSGSIDVFANQTMSFLKTLDLSGNSLRGSLSLARVFAGKPYLQELRLQNNFLTGEQQAGSVDIWTFDSRSEAHITSESLSSFANITSLDLSSNKLSIETSWIEQILKISALRYLDLSSGNQVIPGVLPNLTSLKFTASPTSLEFLGLRSLQLTGSIPPLFIIRDFFPSLKALDLSNNSLQGSLPNWFWYVQGLDVNISGNRFSGKLPSIPSVLLNTQPFLGNVKLCLSGPLPTYAEDGTVNPIDIYTRNCSLRLRWEVWKIALVAVVSGVASGCSCLFLGAIWRRRMEAEQHKQDAELIALLLERDTTALMPLRNLQRATNDFSEENQIGAGGFGTVYRGELVDGSVVAIKKSHHVGTSSEEKSQFLNEVKILSQVHHRYLVRLLGCCLAPNNALLVFEFVPNGTLQEHLNGKYNRTALSWSRRLLIANQTAEALDYLHSSANPPIYHLDVKSANILIDSQLNAKVADFGLSRLALVPDATHISTFPGWKGTFGYMDPELALKAQLTGKSDVYAFGAVMLELISAKAVLDRSRGEDISLIKWAGSLIEKGRLVEVLDPGILDTYATPDGRTSIDAVAELAMNCLPFRSEDRPSMKLVASRLLNIRQKYEELTSSQYVHQRIDSSRSLNIEMVDLDMSSSSEI